MLRRNAIRAFLSICKMMGLFTFARRLMRGKLRVLCYHGFELEDEASFRPSLFVTREFFAGRMDILHGQGYRVLPFDVAFERLRNGTLPPDAVTLTIDDGFYSTYAIAREVLEQRGFPSMLYLTSYYFVKSTPIFRLTVDYMCWKSPRKFVDLSTLDIPELAGIDGGSFDTDVRERVSDCITKHGETRMDEAGRVELCRKLAGCLDVDYDRIVRSRMFNLIGPDELRELQASGMSIGLHTHRHVLPVERHSALAELEENRAVVESATGQRMRHFCYPSGEWSPKHWPFLEEAGIETAMTCESGLHDRDTNLHAVPRILDDNKVSRIEFEAELSGFVECLRTLKSTLNRWLRSPEPGSTEAMLGAT